MNNNVLIIGIVVGCVNYLFRYLPLRLRAGNARPTLSVLLDTIGIASICALLIVSSVPEILSDSRRLLPTLVGFTVLGLAFWKTRSIIMPTLLSALAYGIAWKITTFLYF